ncbi:glycosyltransferase [Candidatus Woesearchaeota archaeon]|nr:glycosyltransferase [Candidatus Woesearchaeota archaeon]
MKVSVIVVTLNEEKNISSCLESLLKQDVPKESYEVLIVDGGSKDATQSLVKKAQEQHANLHFHSKEKGSITECRNIGIKNAKYDFIAFTDADCIVPEDWLRRLRQGFSRHAVGNPMLAGVGGANIPPKDATVFQEAIGIAFNSMLGSLGSIQAQPMKKNKPVFSISCANSLHQKKALLDVGMFSEELGNQGEDWDLGAKLKKKGYIVYGIHDSFVWHNFRATPKAFWKNMVFYGDGRMRLMKKHPDLVSGKYLLPLFFIPVFVVSGIAYFWTKNVWLLVPYAYFPFILLYSLLISLKQSKSARFLQVFLAFLIQHFSYAWGELKGVRWLLG